MNQASRWRLYQRGQTDLLEHLCRIRQLDPATLRPDYSKQLHDPNLLPDMAAARKLIKEARQHGWAVTIFGDYDADGTPAAALLSQTFSRLGIAHDVVLPTRATGYGLRVEDVEDIARRSGLLVTVDTGITSVEEIALAKKLGLKVIVLDHHLPKTELPPADALIDPFLTGSKYPFADLCGCALAYKFTVALRQDFPDELSENYCKWLLELVAISTVADMMPLVGENRVLVHYGLQVLAKTRRPGLAALLDQAGIRTEQLTSHTLGFVIGPRFNASGRLFDNRPALDLILENDPSRAREIARALNKANSDRQDLVSETATAVDKLLWQQNSPADRLLVIYGADWPRGVLGLVAGRISARHNRPTIVLAQSANQLSGSGRSIEKYSLIDGLEASKAHLSKFGGHRLAAGLSLPKEKIKPFVDSIKSHANSYLAEEDLLPSIKIDAEVGQGELNHETMRALELLSPFGQGNPTPLIMLPEVTLTNSKVIGSKADHLKATLPLSAGAIDVVGFGLAERFLSVNPTTVDLVGALEYNHWNGQKRLQLKLKDFRPGGSGADEILALPS